MRTMLKAPLTTPLTTLLTALLAAAALAAAASGAPARSSGMKVAPAHLVVGGTYSDVRYIDMTVPHHLMAIQMAKVELRLGTRAPLKRMAKKMIADQTKEIAALKSIRLRLTGSAATPTMMSMHAMAESGVPSIAQLGREKPTDLGFIDAMVPHHSSLIPMSNVALRRSGDMELKQVARKGLDAQAKEIADMIAMRKAWYPGRVEPPKP